jgi:hypothetical protein
MALLFDEMGNVIGDDGSSDTGQVASVSGGTAVTLPDGSTQTAVTNVTPNNVGYFATKAQQFQQMIYDVDAVAANMMDMIDNYDLDADSLASVQAQLAEYDGRKTALNFAADAFNAVSRTVNAVGGALPLITVPQTLGFAPLVIPVAAAAAIAGSVALVAWGLGWLSRSNDTLTNIAAKVSDPKLRDAILAKAADAEARSQISGGALGQVASIAKWAAIGIGAYLAYQFFMKGKHHE